jgi:Sulfotransferase family
MTTGEIWLADSAKNASAYTEVLFSIDGGDRLRRLIVFHHIQKTAGTAMRSVIRANLRPYERSVGKVKSLKDQSSEALLAWHREYYESLPPERRNQMLAVMSHCANYMLPVIDDRAVLAITLLRDPVDRIVSQYYRRAHNQGKPLEAAGVELPDFYKRRNDATIGDIYASLGGRSPADSPLAFRYSRFFNGQSRSLLDPHYDTRDLLYSQGPPEDADVWRERLFTLVSDRYRVGLQERFDEFVASLGKQLGWKVLRPTVRGKVTSNRPRLHEIDPGTVASMRAYNWLDDELHAHCRAQAKPRRFGMLSRS